MLCVITFKHGADNCAIDPSILHSPNARDKLNIMGMRVCVTWECIDGNIETVGILP